MFIYKYYFCCYISFLKFDLFHLWVFCAMADIFLALVDILIFLGGYSDFLGAFKRPLFIGKQWDTHGWKSLTLKFSKNKNIFFSCYISFSKIDLFHLWVFWVLVTYSWICPSRAQNTNKWNKTNLGKEI